MATPDPRIIMERLWARTWPAPENWHPLSVKVVHFLRLRTTEGGRMVFLLFSVLGLLTANVGISWPIYYLPVIFFSMFCMTGVTLFLLRPRVRIDRNLPERCAAGATITVHAKGTNVGKLPVFDLAVKELDYFLHLEPEERPEYVEYLAPGATTELSYTFIPKDRGVYDLPGPVALSGFPFGLYHAARTTKTPHRMLVYPTFVSLQDVILPTRRKHQPGGLQLVSDVADSEEFKCNREYRPGDRLCHLDHAAWARWGEPIVHEFQQEYLCRIAMVVDTHVPHGTVTEKKTFETAVSLGASIADVLSRREYIIDIFVAGPDIYHFQAGRGLAYLDNILDVLACVETRNTSPFVALAPALVSEIREISTVVLVLLDWDEERLEFLRSIRSLGVATKTVIVSDGPLTQEPGAGDTSLGNIQTFTSEEIAGGIGIL